MGRCLWWEKERGTERKSQLIPPLVHHSHRFLLKIITEEFKNSSSNLSFWVICEAELSTVWQKQSPDLIIQSTCWNVYVEGDTQMSWKPSQTKLNSTKTKYEMYLQIIKFWLEVEMRGLGVVFFISISLNWREGNNILSCL